MERAISGLRVLRRSVIVLLISCAIALISLLLPRILKLPTSSYVPSSLWVHSLMILLSLGGTRLLGGPLRLWGFVWPKSHLSPGIVLWSLPMAVLSIIQWAVTRGIGDPALLMPKATIIIFVWLYASFAEELLVRGLLQSGLNVLGQVVVLRIGRLHFTVPVIISGVFFGIMHFSLWRTMGPKSLVPVILATGLGLVAGWYRERSSSLVPAVFVHSLFNIGGTLPLWLLSGR